MIFSGSVIESTTLPITLILSNANYQMKLVIVFDSISFQLPIAQLPVSGSDCARAAVGEDASVLEGHEGREVAAGVAERERTLGAEGGLPGEREVDAREVRDAEVLARQALHVLDAVDDDGAAEDVAEGEYVRLF